MFRSGMRGGDGNNDVTSTTPDAIANYVMRHTDFGKDQLRRKRASLVLAAKSPLLTVLNEYVNNGHRSPIRITQLVCLATRSALLKVTFAT